MRNASYPPRPQRRYVPAMTPPSGRSPKDFFRPLAVGAPEPLREIPARPSRAIHFFDPSNAKMAAKVPQLVGHRRRAARQPRGRDQGRQQGGRARGPGDDRAGDRLRAHAAVDPGQRPRQPVGARRPDHAGPRDRRQARRGDGAEGAGRRGHRVRRPVARPARGQGRPRPADPGARHPRDGPRRRERRGDLRRLAPHAGSVARPGRPGRRPADEDHARRRRTPGLPRPPGPDHDLGRRRGHQPGDVPAGPVALHDRADGRRVRDARDLALLRPVRRHRRPGRLRGPVPQRLPARLRRRVEPAPRRRSRSPTGSSRPSVEDIAHARRVVAALQ